MRRIMMPVRDYLFDTARTVSVRWSEFWFKPRDPGMLGVLRVLTGLMLMYTHFVWGLDLLSFFGPDGWLSESAMRELQQGQFVFSYLWYVPADWLLFAHGVAMVVLFLFTIGLFSRVTSVLSFLILISYAHRAPAALFGLDQINAMLTMYLAVGPCGEAFSVDRLFSRYRMAREQLASGQGGSIDLAAPPSVGANISIRLIQVHMCVIYFFAGVSKLLGAAWWDGTAIWMAAASHEYQSADLTWIAHSPVLVNLLTHLTTSWELSYCVLIWLRPTRPLALLGAVFTHICIGLFMGLMTFALIMLVGNLSFVPGQALVRDLVNWIFSSRRSLTVVYDGACGLCQRAASWVKAFDLADEVELADFNRVEPEQLHWSLTREVCMAAMQVVETGDGEPKLFAGYWGFKALVGRIRLLWPVAPLFLLPGAGVIGPRLYQFIARQRARHLGCETGGCAIHSSRMVARTAPDREPLRLTIKLPEDAKLFIQDQYIPGEGPRREFSSRPARSGKDYEFEVRVEVTRNGMLMSMSQRVRLRPGQRSTVKFSLSQPDQAVAITNRGDDHSEPVETDQDDQVKELQPVEAVEAHN